MNSDLANLQGDLIQVGGVTCMVNTSMLAPSASRYNVAAGSSRAFSQNNRGIEIGADKATALPNGKVYVGGMLGTAKSDLNFGEGASGNIESRMVGAYATYMNDNGVYVDSVLKYSRLDNDLRFPTNLSRAVKGSYSANAYGADIEVGKHILLDKGWFVEPQLEISVTRTEGGRYTATNGLRVESADMDSLQSRIGSLFGRSLELSNGRMLSLTSKRRTSPSTLAAVMYRSTATS